MAWLRERDRPPDNQVTQYSYDANGNRIGLTDPKQQSFSYSYDELNREITRSYPAPTPEFGIQGTVYLFLIWHKNNSNENRVL